MALENSVFLAVFAIIVTVGSFLAIGRADREDKWRWVAWAGSGVVVTYFVLR